MKCGRHQLLSVCADSCSHCTYPWTVKPYVCCRPAVLCAAQAFAEVLGGDANWSAPMDETYELLGVDPASITGLEQYLQVGPRWCGVLLWGPAFVVACFCQRGQHQSPSWLLSDVDQAAVRAQQMNSTGTHTESASAAGGA